MKNRLGGAIGWLNINPKTSNIEESEQEILSKLQKETEESIELAIIVPDSSMLEQAKELFPQGNNIYI